MWIFLSFFSATKGINRITNRNTHARMRKKQRNVHLVKHSVLYFVIPFPLADKKIDLNRDYLSQLGVADRSVVAPAIEFFQVAGGCTVRWFGFGLDCGLDASLGGSSIGFSISRLFGWLMCHFVIKKYNAT
jgi:hypothetical protein